MRAEIKKIKESLENRDFKAAAQLIEKAKQQLKNYPVLIALEGIYYGEIGDLERALSAFAVALEGMPRSPVLFYNIGATLRAMGRLVAAKEAIQKCLHFSPQNPLALFELAQIQTLQGDHNQAIMTLFKCIRISPFFFPAYVAFTQYLLLDGQYLLVKKLYETAAQGAPDEPFFKDRLAAVKGL